MSQSEEVSAVPSEHVSPVFKGGHLSFVGASLSEVPADLGEEYGEKTRELDLSSNVLT